jgi:predicted esterase
MKPVSVLATTVALMTWPCRGGEEVIVDDQGMDCHVYTPADLDPGKTYQLLVGVHGAGGKGNGAAGLKGWADRGDVIVIGPSFQTKGERPYQNGDGPHAEKLIKLFKQLGEKYPLREKMFLHGFSGGSQFVHRFAMLHPEYVCGVSAHSGGSWATDGFGSISTRAKKIPFAISCGEKDTAMSFQGAKFNRLDWYKRFRDEIDQKGFCYIGGIWPDVGHRISPGAWDLMRQCFQLATGLPGQSATEKVAISEGWKNLDKIPQREMEEAGPVAVPYVSPARLAAVTRAAFTKADEGEIADDRLVSFMEQYPPVLWKDQPGAGKLLEQCRRAAARWKEAAIEAGRFEGGVEERFERFSNGLDAASNE